MTILIGCVNLNTKIFTEIFLDTLYKAINTLEKKTNSINIHTIIIDNGSKDKINDLLYFKKHRFNLIENIENKGCAAGWNQIIKFGYNEKVEPLYDYYLICNNDIYWTQDSLVNLVESLQMTEHNNVKDYGWISLMQNDYKEECVKIPQIKQLEQYYWTRRPHADNIKSKEQMLDILELSYSPFGGIESFADKLYDDFGPHIHELHPKATCFALSKECIQKVGLFDEYNSPTGLHEDADYAIRLKRAGFKTGACYGSYIHHYSMMSRTRSDITTGDSWVNERERAFQEKWGCSSKDTSKLSPVIRLDIGSGYGPRKDKHFYHLDIDKKFDDIEYLHDCSKPLPFDDNSIDEIYCSNNLEHIFHRDVPSVLTDWYNKLKFGGTIEIRVPNLKWCCEQYVKGNWKLSLTPNTDLNIMHILYGGDNDGEMHLHKSGFDFENLYKVLNDIGFVNILNVSQQNSWELRVIANKL